MSRTGLGQQSMADYGNMTARELLVNALALSESDRAKLAAELLASVAPGEAISARAWESAWLAEVERRELQEPDESLGPEHELPAVRQRLLGSFR